PYMEQDNVYKQFVLPNMNLNHRGAPHATDPAGQGKAWFENPSYPPTANYRAGQTKIKNLLCPSAPTSPITSNAFGGGGANSGGVIIGHHPWNQASPSQVNYPFWFEDFETVETLMPQARTNYAGVAGSGKGNSAYFSKWEGVFTNR